MWSKSRRLSGGRGSGIELLARLKYAHPAGVFRRVLPPREPHGGEPAQGSDPSPTRGELEAVGERALAFRRYILRRAYGTYYGIWAFTLFLYILVPYALISTFGPSFLIDSVAASIVIGAGLVATFVMSRHFRKEARAAALRRALHHHPRRAGRKWMAMLWWWGAFIAAAAAFVIYPSLVFYAVIYALLLVMDVQLYNWLARNFQERIPPEGRLAVSAYGAGAVASLAISLAKGYSPWAFVPWSVVVAIWLFSAFYALRTAPEEYVMPPG